MPWIHSCKLNMCVVPQANFFSPGYKGCGKCGPCLSVDCGSCSPCLKKKKFSGNIEDNLLICDRRHCDEAEVRIEKVGQISSRKRRKSAKIDFASSVNLGKKGNHCMVTRLDLFPTKSRPKDFQKSSI